MNVLLALILATSARADLVTPSSEEFERHQQASVEKADAAERAAGRRELLVMLGPIFASAGLAGGAALWWSRRRRGP